MAKILFLISILIAVGTVASPDPSSASTEPQTPTTSASAAATQSATSDATSASAAATQSATSDATSASAATTQSATSDATSASAATTQSATDATNPPSGSTVSGATAPTGGTSISPGTGSSATIDPNAPTTEPAPKTTAPPTPCNPNPCPGGSTCEELHGQSYTCLCLTGDVYTGKACERAKVFPKLLNLADPYVEKMSDKKSQEFNDTAVNIIDNLNKEFTGKDGYSRSVVLELRSSSASKARSDAGTVDASVEITYESDSKVQAADVDKSLENVVCEDEGCALKGGYETKKICDSKPCDLTTATCSDADGTFICSCKDGYNDSPLSDRICAACLPGEKFDGTTCVKCPFGQTGADCKNKTLLIVVIVAAILGGLLLIAVIVLPVVLTKSNKKKSKKSKDEDASEPYYSHSVAKAPLSNGGGFGYGPSVKESAYSLSANSGAPRIPRATHTSNWDKTNLEMTPSNSRQNLIPSGKHSSNPYDQVVQRSNPYGQSGGMNPYSQSRGQSNPYFN